ncbi:hypothetical protein [Nocardia sp. AG03]|uniref:hypothetical protein n=1 Tax=Nocardia sp. AG03 TaxID=3025312 RepID=UPI002418A576|nr:hypothetical protein [Nocardia sp. AG03]
MADGDGADEDTSGGAGGAAEAPPPPAPRRVTDPVVAPVLLGNRHPVIHRGRPRWTTVGLILLFTAALILYLALRPGG